MAKFKYDSINSGSPNEASMLSSTPQLLKDAASLPYATVLGVPLSDDYFKQTVPGAMILDFVPTYGDAKDASSVVNVAAQGIYSFVRHQNSGSKNYEMGDLMVYIMAMDQAACFLAYMTRLYGIARTFAYKNRYLPTTLISAYGLDFNEVQANLANLRTWINVYASKLAKFAIPNNLKIVDRHMRFVAHIYTDKPDTDKCQIYMFKPERLGKFVATGSTGSRLVYEPVPGDLRSGSGTTLAELYAYGDMLMNQLFYDEDIGVMSGDILKAYGKTGVLWFTQIPEEYAIEVQYDETVLQSIQNASVSALKAVDDPTLQSGAFSYTQRASDHQLTCTAELENVEFLGNDEKILLTHKNDPEPIDTMRMTRLINFRTTNTALGADVIDSFGSEIITQLTIAVAPSAKFNSWIGWLEGGCLQERTEVIDLKAREGYWVNTFDFLAALVKFEFHPNIEVINREGDHLPAPTSRRIFSEVQNYTFVTREMVRNMNYVAMLAMLDFDAK